MFCVGKRNISLRDVSFTQAKRKKMIIIFLWALGGGGGGGEGVIYILMSTSL